MRASCAHRTPRTGAELGSFTSFSVCMFKLRFVFVRSGAGGGKGELGSVLLSVRRGSLRVHRTQFSSNEYSVQLFRFFCLNALHSFECLNWQGLKHVQMISFHRLASASRLRSNCLWSLKPQLNKYKEVSVNLQPAEIFTLHISPAKWVAQHKILCYLN